MFISLEGTEGAGKSTAMQTIRQTLQDFNLEVVETREPGGCPFAEELRAAILKPRTTKISEIAELMVMLAARRQHLDEVIAPAVNLGKVVVSDRFSDATYAYQCGGRGIAPSTLAELEAISGTDIRPDATLLLDLPVEIGMERAAARGALDRFEQEKIEFFETIRAAYLRRAREESERIIIIDASVSLEEVTMKIQTEITKLITKGAV